jgi:energy-coupling factor transport system ATP-binding protein
MIQWRGVSYTYPDAAAPTLREIDLTVSNGEWLLLAGPSGGGKSTLLYLLNGLIPHVLGGTLHGEVEVDGVAPKDVAVRELSRRVGTVFQNPETQLFMLRIDEDVAFGCENLGFSPSKTRRRVEDSLTRLSLTPLRDREVSSLSGGQKRRLAIAGALATGCQTLLLDEPTSDLDEQGRSELLAALAELHRDGHTIVMTEHRLDGLDKLVDRAVVVSEGRIVSEGMPATPPAIRGAAVPTPTNSASLVDVQDATFAYPGREPAVKELSFHLQAGEFVALVGKNGSGKTTLLKMLCGLLRPHRGQVVIAGKSRPTVADLVGDVGFLFQNPDEQLFADTVFDEIAFGPKNLHRPVDVDRYLERLGLSQRRDAHPLSLSRGERQRLAAATALAIRPKLILLDEPTTGLDRDAWLALMQLVAEEARALDACVVFSTHHTEVVEAFAGRVLTISQGSISDDRLL